MRSAKWVKAAEYKDEKEALFCDCCSRGEDSLEPAREVHVHGADTTCRLCDGGFLSQVTKWLRPSRTAGNFYSVEFEAPAQLYRIAHMTVDKPLIGLWSSQVVDCRRIVDLGKDPVQAENCLAGLEFCFRAEPVHPCEVKGTTLTTPDYRDGTALLLHDPTTGMVSVKWSYSYKHYFDLACYASLEEAARVEGIVQRAFGPRNFISLAEQGLAQSVPIVCQRETPCLLQVCDLGARCITRCPSIRAVGEEDTAAARFIVVR